VLSGVLYRKGDANVNEFLKWIQSVSMNLNLCERMIETVEYNHNIMSALHSKRAKRKP